MVTSPYEWKILEWDDQPQTNKQTNKKRMDTLIMLDFLKTFKTFDD